MIDAAVAATCGVSGLTEGKHCSVCNEVLVKQETVPATGEHSFVCGAEAKGWQLVTDVNTLAIGDKIVIVAVDTDVALSTTQNGNNRGQESIVKNENSVTITDNVQIITLQAGNADGTFAFYVVGDDTGYLYAASSSSNCLRTRADLDDDGSWLIEIDEAGVATVKAQGTNERNWLRYNSTNDIFACYGSGQGDIAIYKEVNQAKHNYQDRGRFCVLTDNSQSD